LDTPEIAQQHNAHHHDHHGDQPGGLGTVAATQAGRHAPLALADLRSVPVSASAATVLAMFAQLLGGLYLRGIHPRSMAGAGGVGDTLRIVML
jgi:hypothetical protein